MNKLGILHGFTINVTRGPAHQCYFSTFLTTIFMNAAPIAVHWHDEGQPVYSVSMQPPEDHAVCRSKRLATAGGDNNVRVWRLNYAPVTSLGDTSVEYLATLRKHTQAVNAVRFLPRGDMIASAGDDGLLVVWQRSDRLVQEFGHDDDEAQESWIVQLLHVTQLEIYDVCWLPDLRYVVTGAMDNITVVYDAVTGRRVCELADHLHYVQGVAWDPCNEYLATQGADRSVHIYKLQTPVDGDMVVTPTRFFRALRADLPAIRLLKVKTDETNTEKTEPKQKLSESQQKQTDQIDVGNQPRMSNEVVSDIVSDACASPTPVSSAPMSPPASTHIRHMSTSPRPTRVEPLAAVSTSPQQSLRRLRRMAHLYHPETLQSFFRRLAFSPDGTLLLTPLGVYRDDDAISGPDDTSYLHTVYIYTRAGLNRAPVCHLPGLPKAAVAVAFSPVFYEASKDIVPVFLLPYKMVFAVATHDAVYIYDTESLRPLGSLCNLHYLTVTDLCWDYDGQSILVSSAEGFCSVVAFEEGVFGRHYQGADHIKAGRNLDMPVKKADTGTPVDVVSQLASKPMKASIPGNGTVNILTPRPLVVSVDSAKSAKPHLSETLTTPVVPTMTTQIGPETVVSESSSVVSDTPVTPSLLSQFIAAPVTGDCTTHAKSSADLPEASSDTSQRKKRRIAPTLLQTE